jgi:hypothetical protein
MIRSFTAITLAVLSTSLAWSAADLPEAAAILDRFVEVTGGKAAYEKNRSQVAVGTLEVVGMGLSGKLTVRSAAPGQTRTITELAGLGNIESGVYNGRAWENSPVQGPRLLEGDELKQMLRLTRYNGPIYWKELYSKAVTEAEEEVDGKPAYRIRLEPTDGLQPVTAWYDKESGLMVKTRMNVKTPMGELPMEISASDYRDVGGVMTPHTMVQNMGPQQIKMVFQSVEVNPELSDKDFVPPAEIQALLKPKQP